MNIVSLFALAFAVSLDGFGVGITYGIRKIKIPARSIFIITVCSGVIIFLSMRIGEWLALFLSTYTAKAIGASILIFIGIWALSHMHFQKDEEKNGEENKSKRITDQQVLRLEIKQLGLVIQILRTPTLADIDQSGVISPFEASLLGIALSFDAFGAGIGASLIGFEPVTTSLVIAGMCGLFVLLGLKVGFFFSEIEWMKYISYVPGLLLILYGIIKLL